MQLFYTIRDMPADERQELSKLFQHEYIYSGRPLLETKEKVLENTSNVLELFQSYLKLLNASGDDLISNGLDLKMLEEPLNDGHDQKILSRVCNNSHKLNDEEKTIDSLAQNELLLSQFNKTDDDKVSEISTDAQPDSQETKESRFVSLTKSLRNRLQHIKGSLDGDAIEFLKKAFGMKEMDGEKEGSKEGVYGAMVEFLRQRENQQGKRSCVDCS